MRDPKTRLPVSRFPHEPLTVVPDDDQQAYVRAWASANMPEALAIELKYPRVPFSEWRKLIGPVKGGI